MGGLVWVCMGVRESEQTLFTLHRLSRMTQDFLVLCCDSGKGVILELDNTRNLQKKIHEKHTSA